MEKLNFRQVKYVLGSKEAAMEYFVLVENYERYLSGAQKKDFLSATSINEMLELLGVKQINHVNSLLVFFELNRGYIDEKEPDSASVSEWYKQNLIDQNFKFGARLNNKQYKKMLEDAIKKIQKIINDIKTKRKNKQEIIDNYKKNLNKFSGNSIEYRKWIILSIVNSGMPGINKIYDINKLLKSLEIEDLEFIKDKIYKESTPDYDDYTNTIWQC